MWPWLGILLKPPTVLGEKRYCIHFTEEKLETERGDRTHRITQLVTGHAEILASVSEGL